MTGVRAILWASVLVAAAVVAHAADESIPSRQRAAIDQGRRFEAELRFVEAVAAYREALALGESCEATRRLARLRATKYKGSIEEVRALHEEAILKGCAEARDYATAASLAELMGENAHAMSLLERASRLDPAEPKASKRYGGYLERAGRFDEAVAVYLDHLRRQPGDAVFYYFLAGVRAEQDRCSEAMRWFRKFLNYAAELPSLAATARKDEHLLRCPEAEPMLVGLERAEQGRARARALRDEGAPIVQAMQALDEAVAAAPDYAILLREAGELYELQGRGLNAGTPAAAKALRQALFLNEAYLRLAPSAPDADSVRAVNRELRSLVLAEQGH